MSEIAWAAGFFDGEGNTCVQRGRSGPYLAVNLSQNDRRTLERFISAVGAGKVYGPYPGRPRIHHWRIVGSKAENVLALLWPHLSDAKREQVERVRREVNG